MGKQWRQWQTSYSWAPKPLQMMTAAMKLKDTCSLENKNKNLWHRHHIKEQRHYFANKLNQSYGFSSGHIWMWELDYKESGEPKNWCFCSVVLEKTLESPLDCKEIQPVHPKGNQSWIFFGRTDTEAPLLWPLDAKNWLTGKDPDCGDRLKAGGEGNDRGWDSWMASLTWQTWVWASSRRWWRTGKPGIL